MSGINGITVCVNYDDLLAISLPQNMRHLQRCVVVTSPEDVRTQRLVESITNCECFITDAFTRHGAKFNKGLALEEGFDALGRSGWMCIFDADIVFPWDMPLGNLRQGSLYGPRRRILEDPRRYRPDLNWMTLPLCPDKSIWGYFQLFSAWDQVLQRRPWYDVTFTHAGGCDSYFQSLWSPQNKHWLPFEVLHLGPRDTNWFGRVSRRLDGEPVDDAERKAAELKRLRQANGWECRRLMGPTNDRISVPGYTSDFTWNNSKPPEGQCEP